MKTRQKLFYIAVAVLLSIALSQVAFASQVCNLARASYGNIGTDYELSFGPEAVSRIQLFSLHLNSKSQSVNLVGDVSWNNGYAVPNFTICRSPVDWTECTGEAVMDGYQIYGLGKNKRGRIMDLKFVGLDDPAPPAILLPGLSRALYHGLDMRNTGVKLPEDMFYLAQCN